MKQLHFPKILFFLLALQITVDCFNSVTISPFFHSGMYSEFFENPDSMEVFELTVNGKVLNAGNYTIYTWDMVHAPLTVLNKQQSTNDFYFDKITAKKALQKIGLKKVAVLLSSNLDNDKNVLLNFPLWYKNYLTEILGSPIQTLEIYKNYYFYNNGKYLLLKKEAWITI